MQPPPRIRLALEDGEQMISNRARRTCRCSSPGNPQTREEILTIQLKNLDLLAQRMSTGGTSRVCQFS